MDRKGSHPDKKAAATQPGQALPLAGLLVMTHMLTCCQASDATAPIAAPPLHQTLKAEGRAQTLKGRASRKAEGGRCDTTGEMPAHARLFAAPFWARCSRRAELASKWYFKPRGESQPSRAQQTCSQRYTKSGNCPPTVAEFQTRPARC